MHDPICARLEIDLAKADAENARLKDQVRRLREALNTARKVIAEVDDWDPLLPGWEALLKETADDE